MLGLKESMLVYMHTGVVDMRMSFDRLAAKVKSELERSVISGGLYVFFGRQRDRVKILYWDRDGYCIWQKRLEAGKFKIKDVDGYETVEVLDLEEVLSGMEYSRIKIRKNAEKGLYQ
jgi:transposase